MASATRIRLQKCRVPEKSEETKVKLHCKKCEAHVLSTFHFYSHYLGEHRYQVRDPARKRWILGESKKRGFLSNDKDESVSRDTF